MKPTPPVTKMLAAGAAIVPIALEGWEQVLNERPPRPYSGCFKFCS